MQSLFGVSKAPLPSISALTFLERFCKTRSTDGCLLHSRSSLRVTSGHVKASLVGRRCRRAAATDAVEASTVAGQDQIPASLDTADSARAPTADDGSSTPEEKPPRLKQAKQLPIPPQIVRRPSPNSPQPPLPDQLWQNAAILLDKPSGWTSFDVCGKLRNVLQTKKIGHAGTLDPAATGLLIVCTGKGCKSVDTFVAQHKRYEGTLRLGEGTISYDAEAEVDDRQPWEHITDSDLLAAQRDFTGDLMQLPPMFSAIKVKGERLYKAARRGEEVERAARAVTISSLSLQRDPSDPQVVRFEVACSKGTYIRSLVFDLGKALGSVAHMTTLRRTDIGSFNIADAWGLQEFIQAVQASKLQEQADSQAQ